MKSAYFLLVGVLILLLNSQKCFSQKEKTEQAKHAMASSNWDQAIELMESYVSKDTQNAEVFYLLGNCYFNKRNYAKMRYCFRKSLYCSKKFGTQKSYSDEIYSLYENQVYENLIADSIALASDFYWALRIVKDPSRKVVDDALEKLFFFLKNPTEGVSIDTTCCKSTIFVLLHLRKQGILREKLVNESPLDRVTAYIGVTGEILFKETKRLFRFMEIPVWYGHYADIVPKEYYEITVSLDPGGSRYPCNYSEAKE